MSENMSRFVGNRNMIGKHEAALHSEHNQLCGSNLGCNVFPRSSTEHIRHKGGVDVVTWLDIS